MKRSFTAPSLSCVQVLLSVTRWCWEAVRLRLTDSVAACWPSYKMAPPVPDWKCWLLCSLHTKENIIRWLPLLNCHETSEYDVGWTEIVSIVIHSVDDNFEVKERLVSVTTTSGDYATITKIINADLIITGLNTDRILSQVYDRAAVMLRKYGGVQKLLQDKPSWNIPYTHCLSTNDI